MEDESGLTTGNNCIITTIRFIDLPPEIVMEILSWLPIEPLLTCKCVCKGWYDIIKHSYFINRHLRKLISLPPRIIVKVSPRRLYLLDLDQKKAREISSMNIKLSDISKTYFRNRELTVMSSCDSFLCLSEEWSPDPVVVCNPITTEYVILPKSSQSVSCFRHHVCLGFDSSAKKYKAVRMYNNYSEVNRFEIFTLGDSDSSWRQVEGSYRVLVWDNVGPVYDKGAIYWILNKSIHRNTNEYILVLNLSNETFKTVAFPLFMMMPNLGPDLCTGNIQLLNLGGCVTLVQDGYMLQQMWRIKRDGDQDFDVQYSMGYVKPHWNDFSRQVLICNMDEDSSLLKVKFVSHKKHDLVQYFPERRQYDRLHIDGLPKWFGCISIRPDLISPLNCGLGAE